MMWWVLFGVALSGLLGWLWAEWVFGVSDEWREMDEWERQRLAFTGEYPINPNFAPSCEDCEREKAVVTVEVNGALTDLCRACADWHIHHSVR
jgi:hypothetical protein